MCFFFFLVQGRAQKSAKENKRLCTEEDFFHTKAPSASLNILFREETIFSLTVSWRRDSK